MTYDLIHNLFKQRYNQSNWKQFLGEAFAKSRLWATPEILTGIDSNVAAQVQKLGYITLNENSIERQIAVYEVTLAQGIILERNRVGLRNLLRKYWKDIDAAFITYHRPDDSTGSSAKWRFTFVSELTGYDADGEFVKIKTEPKRYTFVLGEGESTRTAAERFAAIAHKGSKATLDDVKEAFSVEKLSKAFFDEYKKHYEIFCDYMVSKPNIRQAIFNGDEKGIRDFNKKLLGRIVFLYFIQKKGWLGVPAKSDWGQGDFDFLTNLFKNTKNPDLFYSDLLSKLFFDTLNTKRKDDLIELVKGEPCRIPYLNGGLFEEDDKKQRNLIFPANLFRSLFDFFNQYNFTIYEDDPNDHTVAVDPEMLGHIFENLLEDNKDKGAYYTPKEIVHYMCQESLIEYLTTWFEQNGYEVVGYTELGKPEQPKLFSANEGRKGQLVLEIENKSSVKKIDRQLIEKLLKKKLDDEDKKLIKKHAAAFHTALDKVKICDPAIGSGAFPMGLLHEIFTAKQTLHTFEHGNTKDFDASGVKLNIIQNSIYGVDIEKGAVDIARLRFWLSLIVDEPEPKALPNLDYKIVVGNSLVSKLGDDIIDIDWTLNDTSHGLFGADLAKQKADLLKKISNEQKEFFRAEDSLPFGKGQGGAKKQLAADIRNLKIDLLITQLQLMVTTKGNETAPQGTGKNVAKQMEIYLQTIGWKNSIKELQKLKSKPNLPLHFFDWKLDFPEVMNEQINNNTGFDIVIGNPPYFNVETLGVKSLYIEHIKNKYSEIWKDKSDILFYFIKKGIDLTKQNGLVNYIISNAFLFSDKAQKLRNFILQKAPIHSIVNFENYSVFESAMITTAIVLFKKDKSNTIANSLTLKDGTKKNFSILVQDKNNFFDVKLNSDSVFALVNKEADQLNFKIDNNKTTLGNLLLVGSGMQTGANDIFSNENIFQKGFPLSFLKKRLNGKAIKKYEIDTRFIEDMLYFEQIESFDELPQTIQDYLIENKSFLENRADKKRRKTAKWWNYTFPMHKEYYNLNKIWSSYRSASNCFVYDDTREYIGLTNTTVVFDTNPDVINLKYLLALLNSKLLNYRYKSIGKQTGGGIYEYFENGISKLPIALIIKEKQTLFETLVTQIIRLKSVNEDTTDLEQEIDNLVYKLYELTYDEVKVIDPLFSLSKAAYDAIKLE